MITFSITGEEIGSAHNRHTRHYVSRLDAMKVYDITTLQNSLIVTVRKELGIDGNYSPREISTLEGDRAAPHEHRFISTDGMFNSFHPERSGACGHAGRSPQE
jgi:hypothetical protein